VARLRIVLGIALLLVSSAIVGASVYRYSQHSGDNDGVSAHAAVTPFAAVTPSPPPTPTATPTPPALSAFAAVVVDVTAHRTIFALNPNQPLAPASTTKIITALLTTRLAHSEDIVSVDPADVVNPVEDSAMGLQPGDTVTVHDLLVGLLLPSGNDAARVLAHHIGSQLTQPADRAPEQRFVVAMNQLAKELGMQNTTFTTPDGDDEPGQHTTAADLAKAAEAFLADPVLPRIAAMPQATVRIGGPHQRTLQLTNTNQLLGQDGVFGLKTGTTPAAGECLVFAWQTSDHTYLGVVLHSADRYADARTLMQWVARLEEQQSTIKGGSA